jgi:hypothetical protein
MEGCFRLIAFLEALARDPAVRATHRGLWRFLVRSEAIRSHHLGLHGGARCALCILLRAADRLLREVEGCLALVGPAGLVAAALPAQYLFRVAGQLLG